MADLPSPHLHSARMLHSNHRHQVHQQHHNDKPRSPSIGEKRKRQNLDLDLAGVATTITEIIQTVSVVQVVDPTGGVLSAQTLTTTPQTTLIDGFSVMSSVAAAAGTPVSLVQSIVSSVAAYPTDVSVIIPLSTALPSSLLSSVLPESVATTSTTLSPVDTAVTTSSASSTSSLVSTSSSVLSSLASTSSESTTFASSSSSLTSSRSSQVTSAPSSSSSLFPTLVPSFNSTSSALPFSSTYNGTFSVASFNTASTSLGVSSTGLGSSTTWFGSGSASATRSGASGSSSQTGSSSAYTFTESGNGVGGTAGSSSPTSTNGASTGGSSSSGGGVGSLTPAQTQMVSGIVGGIAGIAVIVVVAFMILRWKARSSAGRLRLGDDSSQTTFRTLGTPPRPGPASDAHSSVYSTPGGGPSSPFSVAQSLVALTGSRFARRTLEAVPESERGFTKISGRKLPSVMQYGGDGYTDPSSSSPPAAAAAQQHNYNNYNYSDTSGNHRRESDMSDISVYRDSMAIFNQPNTPHLQLGSPMRPESGIMTVKPSPGRTPVTEMAGPPPDWDSPTLPDSPRFQPLQPQRSAGRSLMTRSPNRSPQLGGAAKFVEILE